MKILRYGNLTMEIDLDQKGEQYLIDAIRQDLRFIENDYRWRMENNTYEAPTPPKTKSKRVQNKNKGVKS